MRKKLVYLCDWLPPDFGAVGQYAMLFAREWAKNGWAVTLVGLTSGQSSRDAEELSGEGTLAVVRVHRRKYRKEKFLSRVVWTAISNLLLLRAAVRTYATGGCGAIYRQPTAHATFYCSTQRHSQKAPNLPHHGLSSGMPYCRAGTAGYLFSIYCSVSRGFCGAVSMPSKCWVPIRLGGSRRWVLPRNGFS